MILRAFFFTLALALPVIAQTGAPPAPKKPPFSGFGGTSLDRKPGAAAPPTRSLLPSRTPAATPAATPPSSSASASASKGIQLDEQWEAHLTQSAGGQTRKIDDIRALLSAYGTAARDLDPHPDVYVYEGPTMDGDPNSHCKIRYLMPLPEAEKLLFARAPLPSGGIEAVAPGFPEGLRLLTYDVKVSNFKRMSLLVDRAKPPQVVCMQFKNEHENWHALHWREVPRDWHTYDYVNTRNRGQPGIPIRTYVNDLRDRGGYIIADMAFGVPLPGIPGWQKVVYKIDETTLWYVPKPLISLILYYLSKQAAP